MKMKFVSALISCMLITCLPVSASTTAIEPTEDNVTVSETAEQEASFYSAGLIFSTALGSYSGGSKTLQISAEIYCNDIMSKVGFRKIKIQRSSDNKNWEQEKTIPDMISEDTCAKMITYHPVSVEGGYYYRVSMEHYAKENTWWFPETQTLSQTSNSVWIPQ